MKKCVFLCMVIALIMCFTSLVTAQTITSNQTGTQNGYYYSFWNAGGGSVTMTLGAGGNYSVTWSNCNNFTCGKGWNPGSADKVINYSGSFNGGSNGYLAAYGWTKNALIEYYVVENYGSWTPPGGSSIGTLTSDGGTYNIYKMRRENAPSIIGTASFDQYWSVRTSKRSSGTVTLRNHINAWANKGMNMGSTWDYLIMETEGYQSSGNANITVDSTSPTTGPTQVPTPTRTQAPTLTSGNIMVRARGTMGGENLELRVNNNVVASWIMSTSYQNFYANGTGSTIDVYFTNDDQVSDGMDIQVDYIQYNGTTYQAEDQETNTGVYQNSQCGGSYSEMLQCNGYIRFNVTSNPTPTPTSIITGTAGDVNSDSTVNIIDALMTAQSYVGLNPQGFNAARADVNCDGNINIIDALMIAQYYVGLLNSLSC